MRTSRFLCKSLKIALIPGDGLGVELLPWGKAVLESINAFSSTKLELVELQAGFGAYEKSGSSVPEETLKTLESCDGALFGAARTPAPAPFGYTPPIVHLRKKFNLWSNLRPLKSMPIDTLSARPNLDIMVVRENTECLYAGIERLVTGEGTGKVAVAERHISEKASRRIALNALQVARWRAKKRRVPGHLTVVHKANILGMSDGLFLQCVLDVAKDFPDVIVDHNLLDSFMFKVIQHPSEYDVILAPNTWGNLISNAIAPMVGGLGMVYGINVGEKLVVAEPIHGSPAHLEGKGNANPAATIRSAAALLQYLLPKQNFLTHIDHSILEVLTEGLDKVTPDIGGTATTQVMGDAILRHFKTHLQS